MIVRQENAVRRIKSTNRLFLGSLCFIMVSSVALARLGIALPMEANLVVTQLLFWVPVGLYFLITRTNPFRLIPFRKIAPSTIGMVMLFAVLLIPVMTWINLISMLFVENRMVAVNQKMQEGSLIVNLILMALMPAVSEELMVRGVYFQQYKISSILKGAVLSGIVFGMMHMNFNQFSYTVVLGTILALLVEATGSIFSSMIVHFIFNGQSVLLLHLQSQVLQTTAETAAQEAAQSDIVQLVISYTMAAFIMGILAFSVFLWIVQHCKTTLPMQQMAVTNRTEEGKKIRVVTPTLVIGAALGIGWMFLMEWMGA